MTNIEFDYFCVSLKSLMSTNKTNIKIEIFIFYNDNVFPKNSSSLPKSINLINLNKTNLPQKYLELLEDKKIDSVLKHRFNPSILLLNFFKKRNYDFAGLIEPDNFFFKNIDFLNKLSSTVVVNSLGCEFENPIVDFVEHANDKIQGIVPHYTDHYKMFLNKTPFYFYKAAEIPSFIFSLKSKHGNVFFYIYRIHFDELTFGKTKYSTFQYAFALRCTMSILLQEYQHDEIVKYIGNLYSTIKFSDDTFFANLITETQVCHDDYGPYRIYEILEILVELDKHNFHQNLTQLSLTYEVDPVFNSILKKYINQEKYKDLTPLTLFQKYCYFVLHNILRTNK